jgi:hypothetical protein
MRCHGTDVAERERASIHDHLEFTVDRVMARPLLMHIVEENDDEEDVAYGGGSDDARGMRLCGGDFVVQQLGHLLGRGCGIVLERRHLRRRQRDSERIVR